VTAPTISVIVAAYNGAALIPETLATLAAQTFGDFEVVVVDDCSTDATREVVAAWPDPRVRLVALERNGGPVCARNRAFAEARGRYIAALDHDDLCHPERFARQVAYLDAHPDTVLLGTAAEILENGATTPSSYAPVTTPHLIAWLTRIENPLVWSSVMIRTEAARRLDPFTRPDILYAEDFDLYHRIQPLGRIARLDTPLIVYRSHPGGISKRFIETMEANTRRVLTDAYAPVFGDGAKAAALLVAEYMMAKRPVPGRATLAALGQTLATLQTAYFATHDCNAQDRRLIKWETARRWAQVGRTALRAGTIGVADVIAVRPEHLGLGYAGVEALMWSGLVGGARRLTAQTLAAKIIRPGPSRAKT
jgi:glycosyltransferase involved in cell wall biosynthesis